MSIFASYYGIVPEETNVDNNEGFSNIDHATFKSDNFVKVTL
jgi:hypothetical protein